MRRREWIWIWRYILGGSGLLFGGLSTPQHTAVIFASWAGIFQDTTTLASSTLPHFVGGGEGSSSGSATWDESYGLLVLNLILVLVRLSRYSAARGWHSYRVQSGQVGCVFLKSSSLFVVRPSRRVYRFVRFPRSC